MQNADCRSEDSTHRDPIAGKPGAHPLGTAAGAASGGVTGAVIGTAAGGPIGTAVGAAVGAIAGGLAGHAAGEALSPSVHDVSSRQAHTRGPYERIRGKSRLAWQDAKHAARAAWDRVGHVMPGDFDNDGR